MKLNAAMFGWAWAGAFSVVWVVAGLLVMVLPMNMMDMGGGAGASDLHMSMGFGMFFTGLLWWALVAGLTGWLVAVFYNLLLPPST